MYREPEQKVYMCDGCGYFFAYDVEHCDERHPYDSGAEQSPYYMYINRRLDMCGLCVYDDEKAP